MKFIVLDSTSNQQEFMLQLGRTLIGREETLVVHEEILDNQIPDYYLLIPRESVSINHALVTYSGFDVWVMDLHSTSGTFVDNLRLLPRQRVKLYPGSRVRIGDQTQLLLEESDPKLAKQKQSLPPIRLSDFGPIKLVPAVIKTNPYNAEIPPGCSRQSLHFLQYLPEIYQSNAHEGANAVHIAFSGPPTDFLSRFLALFESIYLPLAWTVDGADLLLDPKTTTSTYIDWMLAWFGIPFATDWPLDKRCVLLQNADSLYASRGTKWALMETIRIYTDTPPMIEEVASELAPHEFNVSVNLKSFGINRDDIQAHMLSTMALNPEEQRDESIRKVEPVRKTIEAIVDHFKPAHTQCKKIILFAT